MSTTATPPVESKVTRIPKLNPYVAPTLICSNRNCLRELTPRVSKDQGGEPSLQYDCENCNYTFHASLTHAMGQAVQFKAAKPNLPEAMPKGR